MPILTEEERIGTVLAGKYRVERLLARGGMGVVFTGEHTWTGRSVAIKLLPPGLVGDASAVTRFLREGRAATTLRHPHVVEVLDMGQAEDGALFMALELLEGTDLQAVRDATGPLDARTVIELLTPIADALATVHERGFVHRDLKPANVFLARLPDGRVVPKLLDFGITKALESEASAGSGAGATATGIIVGTPSYMAPEQASGADEVGPAADVWALGVVLYYLLSGALPYDAASPTAILIAILQSKHAPLAVVAPAVPPEVSAAVERLLAKDAAARPHDLRAWIAELRRAVGLDAVSFPLTSAHAVAADVIVRAADASEAAAHTTERPPPPRAALPRDPRLSRRAIAGVTVGVTGAVLLAALAIALVLQAESHVEPPPTRAPTPTPTTAEAVPPTPAQAPASAPTAAPAITGPSPTEVEPSSSARHRRGAPRTRAQPDPSGRRPVAEITTEW